MSATGFDAQMTWILGWPFVTFQGDSVDSQPVEVFWGEFCSVRPGGNVNVHGGKDGEL